jgi:hypothetical protein
VKTRILTLCLIFLLLGAARLPAKLVRPGEAVRWSMADGRKDYRLGDMTATFDRVQCAPLGADCEEGDLEPRLTLRAGDGRSVTLEGSPMQNILMLGRLSSNGPVAAFYQSYTGGMHCCQHMRAIVPGPDGLVVVDLGAYDGSEIAWPRDLDGDGNADFVVTDDRFLYAFESYAGSFAPPRVLNMVDGRRVDLSADPRFRRIFEKAAAETRKACETGQSPNGACAAYAANAARLGRFDAAWPIVLARHDRELRIWPDSCKVDRDAEYNCPEGQLIEYPDYPTALRAYLKELGYIA